MAELSNKKMALDLNKVKTELSKFGTVEVCKANEQTITIFITGAEMTKARKLASLEMKISTLVCDDYPIIDALKNSETWFITILKKKKNA